MGFFLNLLLIMLLTIALVVILVLTVFLVHSICSFMFSLGKKLVTKKEKSKQTIAEKIQKNHVPKPQERAIEKKSKNIIINVQGQSNDGVISSKSRLNG